MADISTCHRRGKCCLYEKKMETKLFFNALVSHYKEHGHTSCDGEKSKNRATADVSSFVTNPVEKL